MPRHPIFIAAKAAYAERHRTTTNRRPNDTAPTEGPNPGPPPIEISSHSTRSNCGGAPRPVPSVLDPGPEPTMSHRLKTRSSSLRSTMGHQTTRRPQGGNRVLYRRRLVPRTSSATAGASKHHARFVDGSFLARPRTCHAARSGPRPLYLPSRQAGPLGPPCPFANPPPIGAPPAKYISPTNFHGEKYFPYRKIISAQTSCACAEFLRVARKISAPSRFPLHLPRSPRIP